MCRESLVRIEHQASILDSPPRATSARASPPPHTRWRLFFLRCRDGSTACLPHAWPADHIVPLATQAVRLLLEVHAMSGHGRYVFPRIRTGERCMRESTINAALRCAVWATTRKP